MKKVFETIAIAWLVFQLSATELKDLKNGNEVKIKNKVIQLWAMPEQDALVVKEVGK